MLENFKHLHLLRKQASLQPSYMASTAEEQLFQTGWNYVYVTSHGEHM